MTREGLLLALESAPRTCSAALLRGDELLAEREGQSDRQGAESLLPAVDDVLKAAGAELADVAAFAVAVGPGAFTSLRIAVATAKGLAFGSDAPIAPVSSLAALVRAEQWHFRGFAHPIVALLDARREEAYAAAYRLDADGLPIPQEALLPESVYAVDALVERLPARCALVGEGAAVFGPELAGRLGDGVEWGEPRRRNSLATAVGWIGKRVIAAGGGVAAPALTPRYLRRADAEAIRTAQPLEAGAGEVPRRFDSV